MSLRLAVVAEDKLTQAVLHKCLNYYVPSCEIVLSEVKSGRGNVQRNLAAYANLSTIMPVLVGVDLDHDVCAPSLLASWQASFGEHTDLLIRVAVREIESWILADRRRFAGFVGGQSDNVNPLPDTLPDPKRYLLDFAKNYADIELKRDLLPKDFNRYPRIGPAYNLQMCRFVEHKWRPHVALSRSDSLARAVSAIMALGERSGKNQQP
jgi:hypothetical protein